MAKFLTGTDRGLGGLRVNDDADDVYGVTHITVSAGTLVDNGGGHVTITTGGGGGGAGTVTSVSTSLNGLSVATSTSTPAISGILGAISGGTSQNTYATGDIIYASGANTLAKLAAGSNTNVLTLAGGVPTWAAASGGGSGTVNSGTQYQVAYYAATGDAVSGDANLTFNPAAGTTATLVYVGGGLSASTQAHPVNLIQETATTPALGFGVGLDYSIKPATGEVLLGRMEVQEQAVVSNNETADFVFKLRNGVSDPATTNEVFRMTNTGGFSTTSSVDAGTTISVGAGAGGTVTVGGTGTISTVNGAISAGGAGGSVSANTTVTGGTGVIATAGGVTAVAGDISATAGGIKALVGDITAVAGSISAIGGISKIASILTEGTAIGSGEDLLEQAKMGKVIALSGDTYTIGLADLNPAVNIGYTATFLPYGAVATVTVGGACDGVVAGGVVSAGGFTCPINEPFTLVIVGNLPTGLTAGVQVFGNVTPL